MGATSAVIDGRYKLIFTLSPPSGADPPKYQLYDLATDFQERKDLSESMSTRVAALEKVLLEWSAENLKRADAGETTSPDKVDPALLQRLRERSEEHTSE